MSAGRRVDITALIDAAPFAGVPVWITALCFLVLITDGFDIQSIAFAAPAVAAEWGLKREHLGPVLAASIVGMGIGSVVLGWFGDRAGRKTAFCGCILLLSAGSLASATSRNLDALIVSRLLTGFGLGGAAPLAVALSAEWTPARWRSLAVAIVIVGVPVGGVLGAALAEWIIPSYGWRSVFLVGTFSPVIFLGLALPGLPESPKFLVTRPARHARLVRSLNRLRSTPRLDGTEEFTVSESQPASRGTLIGLVRAPYLVTTLLLWTAFSCNTLALYGFANWLPTVLSASGLPLQTALTGSVWFNFGGIVGSIGGSVLISLFGSRRIGTGIALAGAAAAAALGVVASSHGAGSVLFELTVLSGASLNGMQAFLYAVSAHSYPTFIRGTGMGAASAVARVGGVLSSALGSFVFALGLGVAQFFFIISAVILVTAISFFSLRSHIPGRRNVVSQRP